MPLNTDFNVSPYFDDHDETKNYHKVLFKPHLAVQARELNQLQTILQEQIERFGDNILREGTIVSGGNFVEDSRLQYVKLQDLSSSGQVVAITDYLDKVAVGQTTGIKARIVSAQSGLESQTPNLNTFWLKYLDTAISSDGVTDIKTFADGEVIDIYDVGGVTPIASVVAATTNAVGRGYGVWCGDGIVYKNGVFVRFENALTIVSKYDREPHQVVVGFELNEQIINHYQDSSLLDNANSFNNYNAPGADRLKLTPVLTVKTVEEAKADENFFAIQEYQYGRVVKRKLDTVYSKLGSSMAKRTFEESGNYVVRGFDPGVQETDYSDYLFLTVGAGVGYVEGYRVELNDTFKLFTPQGTSTARETNQNILINYGNYVVVENTWGWFDFDKIDVVDLEDAGGNVIGTAKVRSVSNHTTIGQHRVYLFDVQMTTGSFELVRRIVNGTDGYADTVLNANGLATLRDSSFNNMLFYTGKSSLSNFDSGFTEYTYRTIENTAIAQTGNFTISVAGNDEFPYGAGAVLGPDQLRDLIIVVTQSDGVSYNVGDIIDYSTITASIDGTGKTLQGVIANPPAVAIDVKIYHNVFRTVAQPIGKVTTDFTTTINASVGGTTGPWSLGVPDAYEIVSVTNNGVDVTTQFSLQSGQRDTFYGLSKLVNKSSTVAAGDVIVVNFKAFTKQTTGSFDQSFFNVDSYQDVDLQNIPVYVSQTGKRYNLRNYIDFRPYVDETWTATGGIDPSDAETFPNNTLYMAAPNSYVNATYDYYLGRFDRVVVDRDGRFSVVSGEPSENPVKPVVPKNSMVIGTFYIPPFPSLTASQAISLGNINYSVRYSKQNNRRYTMEDLRGLDLRIKNLEYYTSLSLLEQNTKDLVIQDEFGNNRFKNGIFIDSFKDLRIADTSNPEFKTGIDLTDEVIHPQFETIPIKFDLIKTVDVTDHGEVVTLDYYESEAIDQPYATSSKSLTTGYYNYLGQMFITPDSETSPDVNNSPDITPDAESDSPIIDPTADVAVCVKPQRPEKKSKKRWWKKKGDEDDDDTKTSRWGVLR